MTASLAEVLAARDARAALQAALMARWATPLVSMTLVSPGPVKDDERRRSLMDEAQAALEDALAAAGFAVLERSRRDGPAGPEAVYSVQAPPRMLKALAVALEEGFPWGRLLDADVLDVPAGSADRGSFSSLPEPLPRSAIGLPPRLCLLCGRDARRCMAERTHTAAELAAAVERLLDLASPQKP